MWRTPRARSTPPSLTPPPPRPPPPPKPRWSHSTDHPAREVLQWPYTEGGGGGGLPSPGPPPPKTKGTIAGKNEIYRWDNQAILVHAFLGSIPPPPTSGLIPPCLQPCLRSVTGPCPPSFSARVFDRYTEGGFTQHVKGSHNIWQYLYFMVHLSHKMEDEYTGQESYVSSKLHALVPHVRPHGGAEAGGRMADRK